MIKRIFILVFFISINFSLSAQDPQLFENTWYIQNITIDGVTTPMPSSSEPIPYDETTFFIDLPGMLTGYCDSFGAEVVYDTTENTFESLGFVELGGSCNNIENLNFTALYFSFLDNSQPLEIFEYEITTSGDSKSLLLTNRLGDTALYGNALLAVNEVEKLTISLFPNPANDKLSISSNGHEIETVSIFNLQDQEVMTLKLQLKEPIIDTSGLQAGVYFLKAESETGQQLTAKFVKQ